MLIYLHFLCIFKLLAADAATLEYAPISPNLPLYDDSLHTQRTRKWPPSPSSPSGAYRVQIRRKGRYASETFLRRDDAHRWARQAETRVDQGLAPNKSSVSRLTTFRRSHRFPHNRYVRGRQTAASQQGRHAQDAQARSGQGEESGTSTGKS